VQKEYKGDHSHQLAPQYSQLGHKSDHQQKHNLISITMCKKEIKKERKKKIEKSWSDHAKLGDMCI